MQRLYVRTPGRACQQAARWQFLPAALRRVEINWRYVMSKCVFCDSGIQLDWYEKGLAHHLVEGFHEACLNQGEAEFPEDFQERTGKTVSKLLAMPLGEAIPLLKQGDGSPLSRLLSYQDFDGPIPRGADTLCATCYEHGACRDWVVDAAGGACPTG